jgi:hypothetical protein
MAIEELGENTEITEDGQGRSILRNTATGTTVALGDFVDIVGGIGSASAPVAGTSYFEDLVSDSATTDELNGEYSDNVRAFADGGVVANIDPSTTGTPVQDAYDAVAAVGAGTVIVPPTTITEDGKIVHNTDGINLIGYQGASTIEFTDTTDHGVQFDGARHWFWDGIRFDGVDNTATDRRAWHWTGGSARASHVGNVEFANWGDGVIHFDTGNPFNADWKSVWTIDCHGPTIDADRVVGPGFEIGVVGANPLSGSVLDLGQDASAESISIDIGTLNVGRTPSGPILLERTNANGTVTIGQTNIEPNAAVDLGPAAFVCNGTGFLQFETVKANSNTTADYAYQLGPDLSGRTWMPVPTGGDWTTNIVAKDDDQNTPDETCYFYGSDTQVDDNTGTSNEGVRCLANAGIGT